MSFGMQRSEPADSDRHILERMAKGDPLALGDLYDRYASRVLAFGIRLLGDRTAAEDLVQEVFLQAWIEVTDGPGTSAGPWLIGLAQSRASDRVDTARVTDGPSSIDAQAGWDVWGLSADDWVRLRNRVIDSIYGAGDRIGVPFASRQWARLRKSRGWIVGLVSGVILLIVIWLVS